MPVSSLPENLPEEATTPRKLCEERYALTDAQRRSFEEDGFLILQDLLDTHLISSVQAWSSQVQNWPNVRGKWMPYEETKADGTRILCRTENYVDFHTGFEGLMRGSRLTGVLQQLSGEDMLLFKEKINFKAAGAGGFDAHTDAPAYQHAGTLKHLTINMAVDEATEENGCLEVVRGSHKLAVPLGDDNCIPTEWEREQNWTPVPLMPGDVLIFGSFLAHRSGPNNSSKPRAAIYATYNAESDGGDKHASYYVARRAEWPPTFEREEKKDYSIGALRYGFGSPMHGATQHSRLQKDLFEATEPSAQAA